MRLAGAKTNHHTFDVIAARATARLHKQPIDIPSITANTDPWVETNARTRLIRRVYNLQRVDFYDTITNIYKLISLIGKSSRNRCRSILFSKVVDTTKLRRIERKLSKYRYRFVSLIFYGNRTFITDAESIRSSREKTEASAFSLDTGASVLRRSVGSTTGRSSYHFAFFSVSSTGPLVRLASSPDSQRIRDTTSILSNLNPLPRYIQSYSPRTFHFGPDEYKLYL